MSEDVQALVANAIASIRWLYSVGSAARTDQVMAEALEALECARAALGAATADRDAQVREAFMAGYHCQWFMASRRYVFDPRMKPGDPDGAFAAYLATRQPKESA